MVPPGRQGWIAEAALASIVKGVEASWRTHKSVRLLGELCGMVKETHEEAVNRRVLGLVPSLCDAAPIAPTLVGEGEKATVPVSRATSAIASCLATLAASSTELRSRRMRAWSESKSAEPGCRTIARRAASSRPKTARGQGWPEGRPAHVVRCTHSSSNSRARRGGPQASRRAPGVAADVRQSSMPMASARSSLAEARLVLVEPVEPVEPEKLSKSLSSCYC